MAHFNFQQNNRKFLIPQFILKLSLSTPDYIHVPNLSIGKNIIPFPAYVVWIFSIRCVILWKSLIIQFACPLFAFFQLTQFLIRNETCTQYVFLYVYVYVCMYVYGDKGCYP